MSDLASRNEVMLLAHEMSIDEADLNFLVESPAADLRDLRQAMSNAMFARQEPRFQRLAALSKLLPSAVTAKIAEIALGPVISGRVAGVLDPKDAAKLATGLKPDFLARLTPSLDPQRVAPIVERLPHDLIIRIGKILVAEHKHLVLGRFVAVAPMPAVLGVIEGESASQTLEIAMFCEDKSALQAVVDELDDEFTEAIVHAAALGDALDDALTLLEFMDARTCGRLVAHAASLDRPTRERVVSRVLELDALDSVVVAFSTMTRAQLTPLVNLDAIRAPGVIDSFIVRAHRLGIPEAMVNLLLALDAETVVAAKGSEQLKLVGIREWILGAATSSAGSVEGVLDSIG
ncbi:MAG: hypothetical protein ACSLEW_09630 [Nocardioides sp.]